MIALEIPGQGLRQVRFGWSMLTEMTLSLCEVGRRNKTPWIRRWWSDVNPQLPVGRLRLLREVAPGPGRVLPDYLVPPSAGRSPSLEDQLHVLVTTPVEQVRIAIADVIAGSACIGIPGLPLPQTSRLLDSRGEGAYLEVLAGELEAYWKVAIAPYWGRLRSGLERELDYRSRLLATAGLESAVADVSWRLSWCHDALLLNVPMRDHRLTEAGLWCTGSIFMHHDGLLLGRRPYGADEIFYPAYGSGAAWEHQSRPTPSRTLRELLGETRAALLMDLDAAHTTADIASRHGLAASTVSYHLTILYQAGLLERRREGKYVWYERSQFGTTLALRSGTSSG